MPSERGCGCDRRQETGDRGESGTSRVFFERGSSSARGRTCGRGSSRAYYTAFYAATAALLREGLDFGKHSRVIAAVHRRFVKPGRLGKRFGRDLNWLFELRGIGDYGETQRVPPEEAEKAIETAEQFLKAIDALREAKND
jgi:uncharacterized protein (UPF0332 family)